MLPHQDEQRDQPAEAMPAASPAPSSSAASRFARQRADVTADHVIDLPIPGWDGLYARFRPLTPTELRQHSQRQQDEQPTNRQAKRARGHTTPSASIDLDIDLLVTACQGLFWLVDGDELSADETAPDKPWPTFGPRLLEAVGKTGDSAEAAVRAVYGNAAGPTTTAWRIVEAAAALFELSQAAKAEISARVEGD